MAEPSTFVSHSGMLMLQYKIFAAVLVASASYIEYDSLQREEKGVSKIVKTVNFLFAVIVAAAPLYVL